MIGDVYKVDINFEVDPKGDIDRISGVENVRKALYRRLITTRGTLINRPNYGVSIKSYLNSVNSLPTKQKLALEIQEQFEKDERVSKVLGVSIKGDSNNPDMIIVVVRVDLISLGEQTFNYTISELV